MSIATASDIGSVIRAERKRQGYTQTKLAHYAGVGVNFISELERGKATAELGKTLQVAQTLGLTINLTGRNE